MPHRQLQFPIRTASLLLLAVLGGAAPLAAFDRAAESERYEVQRTDPASVRSQPGQWTLTRDDTRWDDFRARNGESWRVRWNEATETAHRIFGSAIAPTHLGKTAPAGARDKDAILGLAESAVRGESALLGARWEDLEPVHAASKGGRWFVTLEQRARGREVVGGRVDLRFAENGDLVLLGADVYPTDGAAALPHLGAASAVRAAAAGLPLAAGAGVETHAEPELVYLPILAGEPLPMGVRAKVAPERRVGPEDVRVRLAYRVRVKTVEPPGDWMTYVDAATGQILWRYNRVRFAAVTGSVTGDIHPAAGDDPVVNVGFPEEQVFGGVATGTVVSYGFESGAAGWTSQSPWALSNESVHGGTQAWSDSPGGTYANNLDVSITSPSIDIASVTDPVLEFWTRLDLEDQYDFLYVEASADNGSTWKTLRALTGVVGWHLESVDLAPVEGTSTLRVRFRFFSDTSVTQDGCWVDDVVVARRGSAVTGAAGNYSLNTTGGSNDVTTRFLGRYGEISNIAGAEASLTVNGGGGTANFAWTGGNSLASERDMYHAIHVAHARIKAIDPGFTPLDYPLPVFVNQSNYCNAFWAGSQVVFGAGTPPGCLDLGTWAGVMHHEYAHGITDFLYEPVSDPPGDIHEGYSDYFMASLLDDPRVGPGILGPGTMFRTIDTKWRDPEDRVNEVHFDGVIIASALWDMRRLLLPDVDLADRLAHFSRYGFPYTFEDYFLEILTYDDDDANLGNGTPHLTAIRSAFGAHGIGYGPELDHVGMTVQDAAFGNGDGRLDPGERATIVVTFRNNGGAETGVYAKLASADPGVTVLADSVFIGAVGAGAEVTMPGGFEVSVDGGVAVGAALVFDLDLRSDVGSNGDCFMLPVGYVPILLVDDDRSRLYETYHGDSLARLGKVFTRWEVATLGGPTAEEMASYRAVVWFTGTDGSGTFAPSNQTEIAAYLGAGGRLFVNGMNIAEDLYTSGSATAADKAFFETWLHATVDRASEGTTPPSVNGVPGDVVGNGLAFAISGGDGAGNQTSASSLFLRPGAVASLRYSTNRIAALRYDSGHRLFFCGFGFEGVSTQATRDSLMARALAWLCPAETNQPSVAVTAPNGGETLEALSGATLRWTASDDVAVLSVNILLSTNGGASYSPIATAVPNAHQYAWTVVDSPSTQCRIKVEAVDPSSNVGFDVSDADFTITSATDVASEVPRRFALHPAVPNPFNPTTRLRFEVPRPSPVWLEILAVDGTRVRSLVAGEAMPAGVAERVWDGRDDRGAAVAAGVYLARLRARDFEATRKLQLVK